MLQTHKPGFARRALVMLLALACLAGVLPSAVFAAEGPPAPVLYLGDAALAQDDTLTPDTVLTARYSATMPLQELAAYTAFSLPQGLAAQPGDFAVNAAAGEEALPAGGCVNEDGTLSVLVDTQSLGEGAADVPVALSFDVPCTVAPAVFEGDAQTFALESGGASVTVTLARPQPEAGIQLAEGDAMLQSPFVSAATHELFANDYATGVSVEFYKSMNGEAFAANDAEIGKNGSVFLRYTFAIPDLTAIRSADPAADQYTVPLATISAGSLQWPGIANKDLLIDGTSQPFGQLFVNSSPAKMYVVFNGKTLSNPGQLYVNSGIGGLTNCHLWVECKLDSIADQKQVTVTVPTGGGATVTKTFAITENKDAPNQLAKTADASHFAADGRLDWTVSYTLGSVRAPILVDTFNPDEMAYVANSMKVKVNSDPDITVTSGLDVSQAGKISLSLADIAGLNFGSLAKGDVITATYQTRLTDSQYTDANPTGDKTYQNSAQLYKTASEKDSSGPATASATLDAKSRSWIIKTGVPKPDANHPTSIEWTITVQCQDRNLSNLVLYDKFPDIKYASNNTILASTYLNFPTSIGNFSITPSANPPTFEAAPSGVAGNPNFALRFPTTLEKSYTITYTTTIKDEFYQNPPTMTSNTQSLANNAWLAFDWTYYDGTGTRNVVLPSVGKSVGIDANVLQKSGTYDKATGTILWKVKINPHGVNVQSGTITDTLNSLLGTGYEMTYVPGSLEWAAGTTANGSSIPYLSDGNVSSGKISITMGALGTSSATFQFKTRLAAAHIYDNTSLTYRNKATFVGTVNSYSVTNSAVGSCAVAGTMHTKNALRYDYATQTLDWKITVNQNGMDLASPVITDTIQAGQSLAGPVLLDGADVPAQAAATPGGPYYNTAPGSGGATTLAIHLGDSLTAQAVVTFSTKVDPNAIADFKTMDKVTIKNSALFSHNGYSANGGVKAEASLPVNNNILQKGTPGYSVTKGDVLEYTVNINPNGVAAGGSVITDTLPEGTCLDMDSVTLTRATVSGATTGGTTPAKAGFTKSADPADTFTIDTESPSIQFSQNTLARTFSITLPAAYPNASYVLTYRLNVLEHKASYQNQISIGGNGLDGNAAKGAASSAGGGGGGGGVAQNNSLEIHLSCSETQKNLHNVTFHLYTMLAGQQVCVGSAVTSADGKLVFHGLSAVSSRQYTLMQDTASLRDEHGECYGWPMISIGGAAPVRLDETIAFSISPGHNVLTVTNHPDGKAMEEAEKNRQNSIPNNQPDAQAPAVVVASPQTGDSAGTMPYALAAIGALGLLALVAVLLGQGKKQRHQ